MTSLSSSDTEPCQGFNGRGIDPVTGVCDGGSLAGKESSDSSSIFSSAFAGNGMAGRSCAPTRFSAFPADSSVFSSRMFAMRGDSAKAPPRTLVRSVESALRYEGTIAPLWGIVSDTVSESRVTIEDTCWSDRAEGFRISTTRATAHALLLARHAFRLSGDGSSPRRFQ